MRAGGRGITAGRERFALRRALVTAQVALSLVLLVGALLFVRSLQKLLAVDPGFQPEGLVAVNIDLRGGALSQGAPAGGLSRSRAAHPRRRRRGLRRQVAITPISGSGWNDRPHSEGAPDEQELVLQPHGSRLSEDDGD